MKTDTMLSRRRLLAGVPAATAVMTPAAATALGGLPVASIAFDESDPINDAIICHVLVDMFWHDLSADETLSDAECEPARDDAFAAADALARTEPTTLRGVQAALQYAACELDPEELPENFDRVLLKSLHAAMSRLTSPE